VERDALAALAGFVAKGASFVEGGVIVLETNAAHHMRVRRLNAGERVFVADGAGAHAVGSIVRVSKNEAEVVVESVRRTEQLSPVHMLVPIADRDRMLWCAEKCVELGASSWRPVLWHRSRSVSPRGEGESFAEKVRGRMESALVQSHSPWLPSIHPDAELESAIEGADASGTQLVLDAAGEPILRETFTATVTIAVGPEGGFEQYELDALRAANFRAVSLGANVLRFETAAVAALAIVRSALAASPERIDG
jgi:16S rRNA (uracil1498-N3)-methyltransferase